MRAILLSVLLALFFSRLGFAEEAGEPKDLSFTATGATTTASEEEIPAPPEGARDLSGETAPLPQAEEKIEVPTKEFVWRPQPKGFPFKEVCLSAVGGGLFGSLIGLLMSGTVSSDGNSTEDKNLARNIYIFGGTGAGVVAGGMLGYVFSHADPPKVRPPEPTTSLQMALLPRGGSAVNLSLKW